MQNAGSTAGKLIVCKRTGDYQYAKKGVSKEGERGRGGNGERGSGGSQDHTRPPNKTGGQSPGVLEER